MDLVPGRTAAFAAAQNWAIDTPARPAYGGAAFPRMRVLRGAHDSHDLRGLGRVPRGRVLTSQPTPPMVTHLSDGSHHRRAACGAIGRYVLRARQRAADLASVRLSAFRLLEPAHTTQA